MRRTIKRATTLMLSMAMVLSMSSVSAFAGDTGSAQDVTEPVKSLSPDDPKTVGNVNVQLVDTGEPNPGAVTVANGGSVTVNGNVVAKEPMEHTYGYVGVKMMSDGEVRITGDLTTIDTRSVNGSEAASIKGDENTSKLTVDGNVTAVKDGISAELWEGQANIIIGGSINAGDYAISAGVGKDSSITMVVGGGVTSSQTVGADLYAVDNAKVNLTSGSITGNHSGVVILSGDSAIHLVVDGDIAGTTDAGVVCHSKGSSTVITECTGTISGPTALAAGFNADSMPMITTWALKSTDDDKLIDAVEGEFFPSTSELVEPFLQSINYIIRKQANIGSFEIAGDEVTKSTIKDKEYDIANEGSKTITVTPQAGYKLVSLTSSTGTATVTDNGDGTYTLVIPRGGEVTLSAVLEKVAEDSSDDQVTPSKPAAKAVSASAKKSLRKVPANSGVPAVNAVIKTFEKDADEAESTLTASTYEGFNKQLAAAIHNSHKGDKVVVATDKWFQFDKEVVKELKDHEDVELEIRYNTALDNSAEELLGKDTKSTFAKIAIEAGQGAEIEKLQDEKNENRVAFKELGKKYKAEEIEKIYE